MDYIFDVKVGSKKLLRLRIPDVLDGRTVTKEQAAVYAERLSIRMQNAKPSDRSFDPDGFLVFHRTIDPARCA